MEEREQIFEKLLRNYPDGLTSQMAAEKSGISPPTAKTIFESLAKKGKISIIKYNSKFTIYKVIDNAKER